jgi:hypothetical protein
VRSVSRLDRALPSGKDSGTHLTGGWVALRAGLDTERLEEKCFASAEDRTPVVWLRQGKSVVGSRRLSTVWFGREVNPPAR